MKRAKPQGGFLKTRETPVRNCAEVERALRASEEEFRAAFEISSVGMAQADPFTGRLLRVNQGLCRMTGYREAELLKLKFPQITHPGDRAADFKGFLRLGRGELQEYQNEKRYIRKDKTVFWGNVTVNLIRAPDGRPIRSVAIIQDITARKQAQQALCELAADLERRVEVRSRELRIANEKLRGEVERRHQLEQQLLEVSEREKHRIGLELHDGIGQTVAGIGYLVGAVQQILSRQSAPEAVELERVVQLVGKTVQQVHEIARGLFPGELANGGLAEALQGLAWYTRDVFGIACRYAGPAVLKQLDDRVARQVYRIAQEAVHNAAKHSQARSIRIRLSQRRGCPVLTVEDNGVGVSRALQNATGMGRRVMQYRADMIGATLRVESERGKGTIVTCTCTGAAPRRRGGS